MCTSTACDRPCDHPADPVTALPAEGATTRTRVADAATPARQCISMLSLQVKATFRSILRCTAFPEGLVRQNARQRWFSIHCITIRLHTFDAPPLRSVTRQRRFLLPRLLTAASPASHLEPARAPHDLAPPFAVLPLLPPPLPSPPALPPFLPAVPPSSLAALL